MAKVYLIESNFDFKKISYAVLKKVYSTTLFPRVLLNIQNSILSENFAKNIDFECFFCENLEKFKKSVHRMHFDMGLFFYNKNNTFNLKLIDGNGFVAGESVTNIFDYVFSLTSDGLKEYGKKILNDYNALDKSKLLRELCW